LTKVAGAGSAPYGRVGFVLESSMFGLMGRKGPVPSIGHRRPSDGAQRVRQPFH